MTVMSFLSISPETVDVLAPSSLNFKTQLTNYPEYISSKVV